ncbi:MAG: S49 family peptidase [Flavobacteriaceae bacterium]
MSQERTIAEIQKGLWMIVPHMAAKYLKYAGEILSQKPSLINSKEVQGGFVRDVIDPDGNVVNINQDELPRDSVGIIRCVGPMFKYGGWRHWGSDELVAFAREFDNHPHIVGQVWQDDSGGGVISSVPPYHEFLRTKKKPVVSLVDTCGSANYYKNCGTDHIMAENDISCMVGSIGVMIVLHDYSKMLEEYGIVEHIINADPSDHKNKAFELALKGKYKLIKQEYLNPAAIKFQEYVKTNRPNLNLDVEGIISGKMFYAEEAIKEGLIDSIGNLEEAIDRVKFLASARSFIATP